MEHALLMLIIKDMRQYGALRALAWCAQTELAAGAEPG
tara:strand:+ start:182 stop:295 length:114 start_codon:yes stop_codon:yes gene_type:complete